MLSFNEQIKWAINKEEITPIIKELENLLSLAKQKEQEILNDKEVIVLYCRDKDIRLLRGSKVEVDSRGYLWEGKYIEGKIFGRPNTKKYNKYNLLVIIVKIIRK